MNWYDFYQEKKVLINKKISEYLNEIEEDGILKEAMLYSLNAGGKRLRPFLSILTANLLEKNEEEIYPYAIAIEFIHTYSLIHDDLPSMDNDDLRRGLPTCHKKYGEAIAILAGDALLTDAFTLISKKSNGNLKEAIYFLSKACGGKGMILGQIMDITINEKERNLAVLDKINYYKTCCLLEASIVGTASFFNAEENTLTALKEYAKNIGFAFQIIDDILDITGNEEQLGKRVGSDAKLNKKTYPTLIGIEDSYKRAKEFIDVAKNNLLKIKIDNVYKKMLIEFADYIINRTS